MQWYSWHRRGFYEEDSYKKRTLTAQVLGQTNNKWDLMNQKGF